MKNGDAKVRHPHTRTDHRLEISITELSCAAESAPLARRLERLAGVREAIVNPITERAVVRFDAELTNTADIFGVLQRLGVDAGAKLVRLHAPVLGCMCDDCRQRLEERLAGVAGVEAVHLNTDEKSVTVEYVPSRTDARGLREALTGADSTDCCSPDPRDKT